MQSKAKSFWAVLDGEKWSCYALETEDCMPSRDWGLLPKDSEYHQVDRLPEEWELPDGKGSWVPNMPWLQDRAWEIAKKLRDQFINSGIETPKGIVQTDKLSRDAIDGSVVRGLAAGPEYTVLWDMEDNSTVAHTAEEMQTMQEAVHTHVQTCRETARNVRDRIYLAASKEELDSLDLTGAKK